MSAPAQRQDNRWLDVDLTELNLHLRALEAAERTQKQTQAHMQMLEAELARITERGARLVDGIARNRGASEEALEHDRRRLLEESARRVHEFEQRLGREWEALRALHEEPIKLVEQRSAAILEEYTQAAQAARAAVASAERRLEAFDEGVARHISDVAREIREAAALLRGGVHERPAALEGAAPRRPRRASGMFAVMAGLMIVSGYAILVHWQTTQALRDVNRRVATAQQQAGDSLRRVDQERASAAEDTRGASAEALAAAGRAERMIAIMVAPDVRRLDLRGEHAAPAASGHVLWSRTRGVIVAGSRVPASPSGEVYQAWLLTSRGPLSLGFVTPDLLGRVSAAFDIPPELPGTIQGFRLTREPTGGNATPGGATVLSSP